MSARPPGKHAFAFIFITVLIDMIGIGLIMPGDAGAHRGRDRA